MDCTQINFSLPTAAVFFENDMVITVAAPKIDLSGSIFLTPDNSLSVVGGLFFSFQSSFETAMFRVREGFEKLVISVRSDIGKVFGKIRSMWRERICPKHSCKLFKRPAVMVMRT